LVCPFLPPTGKGGERGILINEAQKMSDNLLDHSTTIAKELINYVFYKVLLLSIIIGVALIISVILYKL